MMNRLHLVMTIASALLLSLSLGTSTGQQPPQVPAKIVNFSGYQWTASSGPIFRAGSRNNFDPENAWMDESGALHLRISGSPGKWTAAEVKLTRSLGYGTYRFRVRDASHLEPSAILTMITWDGIGTESTRRELASSLCEIARGLDEATLNALSWSAVASWLGNCPLDFPEVVNGGYRP